MKMIATNIFHEKSIISTHKQMWQLAASSRPAFKSNTIKNYGASILFIFHFHIFRHGSHSDRETDLQGAMH